MGLPYPLAFADPNTNGARLLGGVDYASAAAGILDETGQHYVIIIVLLLLSHLITLFVLINYICELHFRWYICTGAEVYLEPTSPEFWEHIESIKRNNGC